MQKTWVRILTTLITLGVMVMIFCFSMESAEESDMTSGRIAEKVADTVRPEWRKYEAKKKQAYFDDIQHLIRKAAHFTEFMTLGASLLLCAESWFGNRKWLWAAALGSGFLYAVLDEMHQLRVDGRSGQGSDVLIDTAGVLTGVLVVHGIRGWIFRRGKKKAETVCGEAARR